ncbi:MAG: methylated-DNA--[protein]-cysteine S-methyltransferase [Synergistaceae bacterium]|jgi:methylated-DNA-[protein]-cysteine S-methyltransferase|nr:methylated-DNA--[protein]-cysteine S-methyltransferase [Synergistaceae bacterium]
MKTFYSYTYRGVGKIEIGTESERITDVHFAKSFVPPSEYSRKETPLHRKAAEQLREYFDGKLKVFDLPIAPVGTEFQIRCWEALLQVPYGETRSYGDIARAAGSPKGFRAVGMANNRNPVAIIIPCHRIIGSDGKLVGYGGGLDIKVFLLELERKNAHS